MSYYKVDLMTRLLRRGRFLQALRLAWQVGRTRLGLEWRYVFALQAKERDRVPVIEVPGLRIECLSSLEEIQAFERELRQYPQNLLPDDPYRLQAQGALFWIGRIGGQLATLGISRHGRPDSHYFFPILGCCAMLSHFATVEHFRGRGLYPALLSHIVRELADEGMQFFLIECSDWNLGSRRGIETAGFRHIGYGRVTRRGRLSWHPLSLQAEKAAQQRIAATAGALQAPATARG